MLVACSAMVARGAPAAAYYYIVVFHAQGQSDNQTSRAAIPRHSRWAKKNMQAHEGQVSGCRSGPELSDRSSCQAEGSIRDGVRGRAERLVMSSHVSCLAGPIRS